MRTCIHLILLAAAFIASAAMVVAAPQLHAQDRADSQQEAKPQQEPKQIYDESASGADQIAAALEQAKKENRRVLIQWGGNWCGWCRLLNDLFETDQQIARKLMYEYDVVHIDIGRWDKHLDLAEQYEADFQAHGVPFLTVLDAEGNVIANQETSSLEDGSKHDPVKVLAFLEKHQAPYPAAESVFSEGLARAGEAKKLAFIHFGAPWCAWCHRMEEWMAQPEVATILSKEFVDVKIDTDRTIGGRDLFTKMTEGKRAGIPWYAIVDPGGEVLATSFMETGANIGCPWTDEEVAAFGKLLEKVARNLMQDDIAALINSLKEFRKGK